MRFTKKLFISALALLGLLLAPPAARAQTLGISASATPNPVLPNAPIDYTIFITNLTAGAFQVVVTNAVSGEAAFVDANNTVFGDIQVRTNVGVVFIFGMSPSVPVAQLTLSLAPKSVGDFTNQVTVATALTNYTTNLITQVTYPTADLAVGLTNALAGVFTNDTSVIGLFVTNLGPSTAANVVVTNQLPPSFNLVSVAPANVSTNFSGSTLVWNVGSLASGVTTQLLVTVRGMNAGTFNLSAAVSGEVNDTNLVNNTVTKTMTINGSLPGVLALTVLSQQMNRQTGLLEMRVQVANIGTNDVPAFRVEAANLPANTRLYNAAGTNSGNAYVLYNYPLRIGNSVVLTLEFYVLSPPPLASYTLAWQPVTAIDLTAASTNGMAVTKTLMTLNGFLIEFAANIGKTYTIIYQDSSSPTNWLTVQPSIRAPVNRVQWIDSGPPKTISAPTNGMRLYRVMEMP